MLSAFGVPKILSFATVLASEGAGTLATAASGATATNVTIVAPSSRRKFVLLIPSAFPRRFPGYRPGFHLNHEYRSDRALRNRPGGTSSSFSLGFRYELPHRTRLLAPPAQPRPPRARSPSGVRCNKRCTVQLVGTCPLGTRAN